MITDNNRLYRMVKWLWLLLQASILPLAAVHAIAVPATRWPLILPAPLLFFFGTAFLVLWLIAQSLLVMARFPLTLGGALLLIGGTVAQFVFLVASGGSLASAAYSVFIAILAALALVALILTATALFRQIGPLWVRMLALLAQLPVAGLVWFLLAPLRPEFSGLPSWRVLLDWLAMAGNAGLVVFSLYHFSIFSPPALSDEAYAREWERWAAPTIIVLILSAAAAAVLAGIG
ncbi:MAG: hypothetical protein NTZ12_11800 [Candidatus Aminicenantes bacterium]|nr:hypothetical protein [Candidatus Aminicenantes bacterium]